ncbi:MAG: hypothetical protein ACREC6_06060 [Hyphomicrobiaceae bacterium]
MPKTHTVNISGFEYDPAVLVIEEGDTVKWLNKDHDGHTASRDASLFYSRRCG